MVGVSAQEHRYDGATNSDRVRFLQDVDPETPLEDLPDAYAEWRRRQGLDTEQAAVTGWSD